jgi:hypothetical protein
MRCEPKSYIRHVAIYSDFLENKLRHDEKIGEEEDAAANVDEEDLMNGAADEDGRIHELAVSFWDFQSDVKSGKEDSRRIVSLGQTESVKLVHTTGGSSVVHRSSLDGQVHRMSVQGVGRYRYETIEGTWPRIASDAIASRNGQLLLRPSFLPP